MLRSLGKPEFINRNQIPRQARAESPPIPSSSLTCPTGSP